jgi:hypothetical protein
LGIGDWGLGIGDWAQSPIPILKQNYSKNLILYKYNSIFRIKSNYLSYKNKNNFGIFHIQ